MSEEAAASLRKRLLEAAAAAYPERPPVIVREWTDPVLLHGPEPVGHRTLVLVATGADDHPADPVMDAALDAFAASGWPGHRWNAHPGEIRASAGRDDFSVMVYAGQGAGMVTFTGWTPVVFPERDLRQPRFTALPGRRLPGLVLPVTAPPCPRCAATPIPLVAGLYFPGTPMMRAEEQGLVARLRASSEVRPDDPNWRCASCAHEWRDTDARRREKFMRALLDDLS
ncbi:hypothetical protein ACQP1W_17880 [Spirillospora sp. CA-255316]